MYCRVILYDPLSDDELEELGWFAENFAENFCSDFCEKAYEHPTETRLAAIAERLSAA